MSKEQSSRRAPASISSQKARGAAEKKVPADRQKGEAKISRPPASEAFLASLQENVPDSPEPASDKDVYRSNPGEYGVPEVRQHSTRKQEASRYFQQVGGTQEWETGASEPEREDRGNSGKEYQEGQHLPGEFEAGEEERGPGGKR